MQTSNVIDKNWKALIKPNKLEITSNEDKSTISNLLISIEKSINISNVKKDSSCHLYENQIVIN